MKKSATAVAPCSTANLGPGFDVFGLALDALEDRVTISKLDKGSGISIRMVNVSKGIPLEPMANSAGRVVEKMVHDHGISDPLMVEIRKGVPAGYGLGSSAASASAAAVAMNSIYGLKIGPDELVEYAAEGEIASAGAKHYDNVSASLLGGFVISSLAGGKRSFIRMKPPGALSLVVAMPLSIKVPEKKTQVARSVLPERVPLKHVVHNVSMASTIVAGFAKGDVATIARGIEDVIVEPARKGLIPGYDEVKRNALDAGALAVTISGAGPSMIAFLQDGKNSRKIAEGMKQGFAKVGVQSKALICHASSGTRLA
jgi:homoserine kinase